MRNPRIYELELGRVVTFFFSPPLGVHRPCFPFAAPMLCRAPGRTPRLLCVVAKVIFWGRDKPLHSTGGVGSLPWLCLHLGWLVSSDPWAHRVIAPAGAGFLPLRASKPPAFTLSLHRHPPSCALKLYQASLSTSLTLRAR